MGNRAVITTRNTEFENGIDPNAIGVYLHWNGGVDCVTAFLRYCKKQGFRSPEKDNYGWARLCQVIGNFFSPEGLSVGVDICSRLDCNNGDNGVYFIEDWEIVGKAFESEDEVNERVVDSMLEEIDASQPKNMSCLVKTL